MMENPAAERRMRIAGKKITVPVRSRFTAVRLSEAELQILDQRSGSLGLSRSAYLRKLLLEKEITNHIEVVADMQELKKLVGEYGKIGSNLNQIAKYFNTGGDRSLAMEDEIRQCISDLFLLRDEVLKMAGDYNGRLKAH